MAKDGGASVDVAPDSGPTTLNLDAKSVFWLSAGVDQTAFYEQAQGAAAGSFTATYPFGPNDDLPVASREIAVDESSFYWTSSDASTGAGTIVSRKRDPSGSVVTIYRGGADDTFSYPAVDATHVYAIDSRASSLLRVPKNGGDAETLLTGLAAPSGVVVDATSVYVTVEATGNTGRVLAVTK
jgi:hypothetical protein